MTEQQAEFIRIISDGGTWREARAALEVGNRTVSVWLQDETFREQYARACDIRAEAIFEDILDIADNGTNDWMRDNDPENEGYRQNGEAIRRTQVRIDARKWVLGKMKPKVYGDKIDHTLGSEPGKPLVHEIVRRIIAPQSGNPNG